MTWYKRMDDGELVDGGLRVFGPTFNLDETGGEGADGWFWVAGETNLSVSDRALSEWEAANRNPATNTINEIKAANLAFISAIRMGQSPIDPQ